MQETQEILDFYHLSTSQPQSWVKDTAVTVSVSQHKQLDMSDFQLDEDRGLELLLRLVNMDLNYDSNPIDPLNPAINVKKYLGEGYTDAELLKFSINSKQFNSKTFLKAIHKDDTFDQLTASLNILDQSILHQNQELQKMITSNHLKFLRSKFSIDGILKQFDEYNGNELDLGNLNKALNDSNKESTINIKPTVSFKTKEMKLRQSLEFVDKYRHFFNLSTLLTSYLTANDHDNFIAEYKSSKAEMQRVNHRVINKIWDGLIESIVDNYKISLWDMLGRNTNNDEFMVGRYIGRLLELDSVDNPIMEWAILKIGNCSKEIQGCFERWGGKLKTNFGSSSNIEKDGCGVFKVALRGLSKIYNSEGVEEEEDDDDEKELETINGFSDSHEVLESWIILTQFLVNLSEIITSFHSNVYMIMQKLIRGEVRFDSKFFNETNRGFVKLTTDEKERIVKSYQEMVFNKIIAGLLKIFSSTTDKDDVLSFDFIPNNANTLSTMKYCTLITRSINDLLTTMGQFHHLNDSKSVDRLRETSTLVNEQIISGVCATFVSDCMSFHLLEDWVAYKTGHINGTFLPSLILAFQKYVICGLKRLLYDVMPQSLEVTVVRYPNKKILTGVEVQFLRSLDILLESIVKKIIEENNSAESNRANSHKLLSLLNIQSLQETIFPTIVSLFDKKFETKLSSSNLQIFTTLTQLHQSVLETYLKTQHKRLTQILSIAKPSSPSSIDLQVSGYIFELLNCLNTAYFQTHRIAPSLLTLILTNLIEHTSTSLLHHYRQNFYSTDEETLRQSIIDIQFLHAILIPTPSSSISDNQLVKKNLQLLYKALFGMDDYQDHLKKIREDGTVKEVLEGEIEGSRVLFEIFNHL